jgi:hypothetical protein
MTRILCGSLSRSHSSPEVAVRLSETPGNSVSSKRPFSTTNFNTGYRIRIKAEKVDKTCFIHTNGWIFEVEKDTMKPKRESLPGQKL